MKQNPTLNYKADYIEHRFEARAMLPPICDALRNRLFVFTKYLTRSAPMKQMPISKLNDRLNGDTTLRRYERSNAGVRLPGRNDIRVERRKRF